MRSARPSALWGTVCKVRSKIPLSTLRGASRRANSSDWLNPRSRSRSLDSGIGSTRSACSSAGSTHGALRIKVAKLAAQPGSPWNLKLSKRADHGKAYATAATQASSGGGSRTQAPHCPVALASAVAQVLQRIRGWANCTTQASQTGSAGHAMHTAHCPGSCLMVLCSKCAGMLQYTRGAPAPPPHAC